MRKLAPTLVVFFLLWSVSGCGGLGGQSCTEIGCTDGLQVTLVPGEGWPAGHYVFSIQADGAMQTCDGDLPLMPCSSGPTLHCQGATPASIGESGCALAPSAQGFADIVFQGMPAHVVVQIDHDGTMIANQDLTPTYVTSQPNGPDCPPTCHNASAQVTATF